MKVVSGGKTYDYADPKFQSPCGEKVVKEQGVVQFLRTTLVFQSPCGEEVVKVF